MGQILKKDRIGTLSHSAGDINLTASTLTIGGQQYVTSALSRTIATDITMVANTRYQIYVVISGGVPVIRISANENSVGPVGFTSWKLAGSFYSSGTSTFGAFLTIEGTPISDWESGTIASLRSSVANPVLLGTMPVNIIRFRRKGADAEIYFSMQQSTVPGAGAQSGTYGYRINMPTNLQIDTAISGVNTSISVQDVSYYAILPSVAGGSSGAGSLANTGGVCHAYDANSFRISGQWGAVLGIWGLTNTLANTLMQQGAWITVPIVGWSNTPIEDL